MKNIIIVLLLLFSANILAENYNNKLTLDTYIFLKNAGKNKYLPTKNKSNNYFLYSKEEIKYTKLYTKVNENYSKKAIEELGCKELVKTKSVVLLSIPIDQIEKLLEFDFVERIEIAKQPKQFLDKALLSTNVDKVHQSVDLMRSYFGEGVIVGVLDIGFDFTHPMFSDENGNSRIKRAWIVGDNSNVNPPAGFESGTLYTDSFEIKNIVRYGNKDNFHASNVLGIAAGTPVQTTNSKYSGVATKSDIAVVTFGDFEEEPDVEEFIRITSLEGFAYLFQYADSVNKPIVINYSAGWYSFQYDPDGNDLVDVAISELLNEHSQGKILVAAAGNSGSDEKDINGDVKHFEINNTSTDFATFIANYNTAIIFWGEENKNYSIEIQVKNKDNQEISELITLSSTDIISFLDTVITYQSNEEECDVWLMASVTRSNITNRSAIQFYLSYDYFSDDTIMIVVRGNNQIVHAWGVYSTDKAIPITDNIVVDGNYTMGSPAMLDEVIGVGAYTTNNYSEDYNYDIGDIAAYSSRGPLLNGKIKPDITAPGHEIVSAFNSFYYINSSMEDYYYFDNIPFSNHRMIAMGGTSAASPMVAGIVALMLEKKPNLTQAEAKEIIRITAINDKWTGDVRDNKSTTWGWGKINAHGIMKYLEESTIDENFNMDLYVFPNPTADYVNLIFDNPTASYVKIDILNAIGQVISTPINQYYNVGIQSFSIGDLKLSAGTYFIRVTTNKTTQQKGFIVW